jgi:hypothetical protein
VKHATLFVLLLMSAAAAPAASCRPKEVEVTRITYEASMPFFATLFADWSEVQQHYPQARGITRGTTLITRDILVEIDEGIGIALSKSTGVPLKLRGRPYPFGYKHVQQPISNISITTARDVITYTSASGEATRARVASRKEAADVGIARVFGDGALDDTALPLIGERTYAGMTCIARRLPAAGAQTESCVRDIVGWPVTLYFQYLEPVMTHSLQWKRAVRIEEHVCVEPSALALPAGTVINDDDADDSDDAEPAHEEHADAP